MKSEMAGRHIKIKRKKPEKKLNKVKINPLVEERLKEVEEQIPQIEILEGQIENLDRKVDAVINLLENGSISKQPDNSLLLEQLKSVLKTTGIVEKQLDEKKKKYKETKEFIPTIDTEDMVITVKDRSTTMSDGDIEDALNGLDEAFGIEIEDETDDILEEKPELVPICDYGCGRPAIKQFNNGRWCCSERVQQCPGYRKKTQAARWGK